ncbi:hypothetical protein OG693_04545 [Streptomyces sp. NBC_01259]|uniref:hypothetical protein n=1 Tax=Streptomyces sp. NBC_01259 TaxID=2903800 RepID=UPI00325098A3
MELIIPLRQIDLPLQIDHLGDLGADFTALHTTITTLAPRPGSDLLRQLSPQILAVQELVGRALIRLLVLDGSQYTAAAGSRFPLEALSEVAASASIAASQLARAVGSNPLDGAGVDSGPPDDVEPIRQDRHAEAAPVLVKSLAAAAQHLDLSATGCLSTATAITLHLKEHPEHGPQVPQLTKSQYAALARIAQGGTQRHNRISGPVRVQDGSGRTIHPAPLQVLQKYRLIRAARTTRYTPHDLGVTAAGLLVLDFQKPDRPQTASPAVARGPRNAGGRRL